LIRDARTTSPTFRRLIARLERSDVIVYVTRHYDMSPTLDGQVTVTFVPDCTKNLALVSFEQTRPF